MSDANQTITPTLDRLLTVNETKRALAIGTTKFYELVAAGDIDARKLGRHTRVTETSVASYQASLPRACAQITTGRGKAA